MTCAKLKNDGPIFFIRVLRVAPETYDCLYAEICAFVRTDAPLLEGFVNAEVYGGEDATMIVLIAQWASRGHWSRAQWDDRLGRLLADVAVTAETVCCDLCDRRAFGAFVLAQS